MRLMLNLLAYLMIFLLKAQITGIILSSKDSSAIEYANIQLLNSDRGWISKNDGTFYLDNVKLNNYILISHVSYEDQLLQINGIGNPIFLHEKEIALDQVEVKTGKNTEWKRDYKIFIREIFGESTHARKTEILNPWVIDFESEDGKLTATSNEPIEIVNKSTGYRISFFLESFSNKGQISSYHGKPFFSEMEGKYKKRREETFRGSIRHFIFSLVHNISREQGFRVYECRFDSRTKTFITESANKPGNLVTKTENGWEIGFDGYLKVIYLNENDPYKDVIGLTIEKNVQVSYLKFYQTLLADKFGNLMTYGLQDYGYWANVERFAHRLPHNYVPEELKKYLTIESEFSSLERIKGFSLENLLIPKAEISDGGVPRDGIRALNYPKLDHDLDSVDDDLEILGIHLEGQARAYPIKILNFHEAINDTLNGKPILVTFCPLCGSGVSFLRGNPSDPLEFAISGLLYNSDVLLFDRQTESLWSQLLGMAISGSMSGKKLEQIATSRMTWSEWIKNYPESSLITDATGFRFDYSKNPYDEYLKSDNIMFPVANASRELSQKELVLGVTYNGTSKAYPFSKLDRKKTPFQDEIGGKEFTVHYSKETNKAWISDEDWDNGIKATVLFWFAWYAFHPDTEVYK